MLSGTIPSNLTNIVDSLFSPFPPRKDIWFKEHLILNKQQQQKSLLLEYRGSVKDENRFDSNLPVAALWSPTTSVVVVIPRIYSSVCSHNLESSFTFISGKAQLCFTDTFPLEMYQPLQELTPSTALVYHPDFGSQIILIALWFLLLLQTPNLTLNSPIAKQNGAQLSHFESHKYTTTYPNMLYFNFPSKTLFVSNNPLTSLFSKEFKLIISIFSTCTPFVAAATPLLSFPSPYLL